ncbi:MAG: glycosyltransferase family 9 protein [Cytophagales bacterium]|nr:glycosyltransferase family 9 protein [Cytophagales bacterium]
MKVLIIRFSSIGDIAWTTPIIRRCKLQLPDVEVHYLTKKNFAELVSHNPHIDKLWLFDDNLFEIIKLLHVQKYDYVIDLHNNLRTWLIKAALQRPTVTHRKMSIRRYIMCMFKINLIPAHLAHVADRFQEAVSKIGVNDDGLGTEYYFGEHMPSAEQYLPKTLTGNYTALVIGGSKATKQLPIHKLEEIITKLNHNIVLIGGTQEAHTGNILQKKYIHVTNLCGKLSLSESAKMVQNAQLIIGNDTGLMHIAAAFSKKMYTFWGSTNPDWYAPYRSNNVNVRNTAIACSPCSKLGAHECPQGHFKCMNEVQVPDFEG